ncbi:hypothetical protein K435DRAFT_810902, partial [Dendrothele bispora CBS 962.96]
GLVNAWTANDSNALPLVVDRARLTVFRNLRDAYEPSIFKEDAELRSWVQEEEEQSLNQGLAQPVTLAECKFGRLEMPFLTMTTNEDGAEESVEPDHSAINFGPPKQGDKPSTSNTPSILPKPTCKSTLLGSGTRTGTPTPSSATKIATATRSAPGMTTLTRTSETTHKQPTKPAQTVTKSTTASKAPTKISGGASKSSTPRFTRPVVLVPPVKTENKGSTSTSTTPFNPHKRTQDAMDVNGNT